MTDILQLAAKGDASNVLRDMRVRSLWSNYYFTKVVLGYKDLSVNFHRDEMEGFVSKWADGWRKQAIEWSRGFFKTTCFTVGTGIWVVLPVTEEDTEYAVHHLGISEEKWFHRMKLHDQDATQLLAFEVIDNAKKKVFIIKQHFEENQIFRTVFPEIAYQGSERPWNNECLRIRRVGLRQRDAEGTFEAIGVGGSLQSRHYKIVWEDDLVGEKATKSGSVMEQTIGWHGRLSGAFEDATEQTRFLVSNRWGYNDLNSYVRVHEPDFIFHTRSAIEMGEEGERPAFPERYSFEKLLAIRDSGSMTKYDFSCQYLNSPVLPGEREVNVTALHYYDVDTDGKMTCSCGSTFFLSQLNRYIHYDPYNAKGAGSTSCPAIVVIATGADRHVFLIDYFTTREQYGGIYDRIFRYNDVYRPRLFTYEDAGHQNLTSYHITEICKTQEYKEKHKNFPKIEGVPTGGRSKEVRIREGLFPIIEKGKFAVRKKQQMFLNMLETFPHKQLDHDYDILDAIAQGNNKWRYPETEDARDKAIEREDDYLRKFNEPYSVAGKL